MVSRQLGRDVRGCGARERPWCAVCLAHQTAGHCCLQVLYFREMVVQDERLEELLYSDTCFMAARKFLSTHLTQPQALPRLPAVPAFMQLPLPTCVQ
jgi:hypothetical protein